MFCHSSTCLQRKVAWLLLAKHVHTVITSYSWVNTKRGRFSELKGFIQNTIYFH